MAVHSNSDALDCARNACRVPIYYRQYRHARIAAASFPQSFVVMAFGSGPSIGSGKRERWYEAYNLTVARSSW